jgi:hypothetical protein
MALLCCSKKLLAEMGAENVDSEPSAGRNDFLQCWYAHLFYWNRKKCILFTEGISLFSFVRTGILKRDLADIAGLLRNGIARALYFEEFSAESIRYVLSTLEDVRLGVASDRSIRGCMNELILHWKYAADEQPAMALDNAPELNRNITELPMRVTTRHGIFPKERFRELFLSIQTA